MNIFILLFFLTSCSQLYKMTTKKEQNQAKEFTGDVSNLQYVDGSGQYAFVRDTKSEKNKVVTRQQLKSAADTEDMEKSIMVSELGRIGSKDKNYQVFRPSISQFTVWLEGKKYFSQLEILRKSREILVRMDSPESKWKGEKRFSLPKSQNYCFFNQLPECLHVLKLLKKTKKNPGSYHSLIVIWDSFPYNQEQFTGMGNTPFSKARIKFERDESGLSRYNLEIGGQNIFYHFTNKNQLAKLSWISQGVSVFPSEQSSGLDDME